MRLTRRTGVEIELLAPEGGSRRTLAEEIARRCGGWVGHVFHTDSEPSLVPGMGVFLHLTQGFTVHEPDGRLLCTLVDDITLNAGLDREAAAPPGWFRVLTDDARLLGLIARGADPAAPLEQVLAPLARLFGAEVTSAGPVRLVRDPAGCTVALAAPLPGQRERPCEVVTVPLVEDHERSLEALLRPARDLGFTVPVEAAVHLHVDGAPFRDVTAFCNLVRLFGRWREPLRAALGTNPGCTRLRPLPADLVALVERPWRDWPSLQRAAAQTGLTKYFDVNLTQLLTDVPVRDTVEVRVLPGALHGGEIVRRAALLEGLLDRCGDPRPVPPPPRLGGRLRALHALAGRSTDSRVPAAR